MLQINAGNAHAHNVSRIKNEQKRDNQSQKQVLKIFNVFRRRRGKRIIRLKSALVSHEQSKTAMLPSPTMFGRRRYQKGNPPPN